MLYVCDFMHKPVPVLYSLLFYNKNPVVVQYFHCITIFWYWYLVSFHHNGGSYTVTSTFLIPADQAISIVYCSSGNPTYPSYLFAPPALMAICCNSTQIVDFPVYKINEKKNKKKFFPTYPHILPYLFSLCYQNHSINLFWPQWKSVIVWQNLICIIHVS